MNAERTSFRKVKMSQTAHMPHDVACNLLDTASQPGYVCVLSANRPEVRGLGSQLPFKEQPTGHTHTCVCMCPALRQIIKISLSWQFTFYPVPNCVIRDSFFSCLL